MRRDEALFVLGLSADVVHSEDAVRTAYKKKALQHHPDKNGAPALLRPLAQAARRTAPRRPAPPPPSRDARMVDGGV